MQSEYLVKMRGLHLKVPSHAQPQKVSISCKPFLWRKLILFEYHQRHYHISEKNDHQRVFGTANVSQNQSFLLIGRTTFSFCFQFRTSLDRVGVDGKIVKLVVSRLLTASPIRERDLSVEVLLRNLSSDLALYATGLEGLDV